MLLIEDDDLTLEELQYIYAHTLVLSKLSVIQAYKIVVGKMKFPPIVVSKSIKEMSEKELNNAILNVHVSPSVKFILNLGVCY